MPTYDYKCDRCGKIEEHSHKINERMLIACKDCCAKGYTSKFSIIPSKPAGVHFKGSGFYETDYKGK